uniref:Endonuclease/exonuclease/phosphatase domain-containing protein n=1 Tax=Strigamia maritima TaxID=126957 RepID=T1IXY8_STRMM
MTIIAVYCNEGIEEMARELGPIIEELIEKGGLIVLAGDFNARTGTVGVQMRDDHECRQSQDGTLNKEGRHLLDFGAHHGLKILNDLTNGDWEGKVTSINARGSAVVDYIIVNDHEMIDRMEIHERIESDHLPIQVLLNRSYFPLERGLMMKTKRNRWNWKKDKGFDAAFDQCLQIKLAALNGSLDSVDTLVNSVNYSFNTTAEEMDCREEKQETRKALKKVRKSRSDKDRRDYVNKKTRLKKLYQQKKKREEQISKKRAQLNNISPEQWNEYFCELLDGSEAFVDTPVEEGLTDLISRDDDRLDQCFSLEKFQRTLSRLKRGKAPGKDSILNKSTLLLLDVVNRIWLSDSWPDAWRDGLITPIHKAGDYDGSADFAMAFPRIQINRESSWL